MNKKLIATGSLVAIVGAAVVAFFYFQPESNHGLLRVSGNIEVTDVEVSFKLPGWVKARPASEGQFIQAGDPVAELDSTELSEEVLMRQAELAAYRAELAALLAGSRPEEIAEAQATVRLAQAELNRLKLEYERAQTLLRSKTIAQEQYDSSLAAYEVGQARRQQAREQLKLVQKGPRQEEIDRARARLEQATQSRALAETRLGYATLNAPIGGVVLSENVEAGEYVVPGVPIVTVGDLVNSWLRAYVNETDLGRVKVGQEVCISTDTYPDRVYAGSVSFISSQAEFTPKNVQTAEERVKLVYRIKIDVPNTDMELKPGMPADADIWLGDGQAPCLL
ncbi:MAG: HlyD family efflux transporter periplasmic adaptor subunit [Gammaproteobacteria bacterium]|nr:HlyD family efflux transporter periplasmic adaptor subunit [Gammaproteobacteria bacterium]